MISERHTLTPRDIHTTNTLPDGQTSIYFMWGSLKFKKKRKKMHDSQRKKRRASKVKWMARHFFFKFEKIT